jgi:tetratricopeptide (TPR) repeat protein
LKILSHADEENKKILLHDFDNICQETFEIATFYEYVEGFIQEVSHESDLSDEERQHLLLSYGLLKQLQETSNYEQDAFLLFKKAGEIGNIEGYLYMCNLLFQNAQYDESIQVYEQALLIQPSLNTLLLLLKSALI